MKMEQQRRKSLTQANNVSQGPKYDGIYCKII